MLVTVISLYFILLVLKQVNAVVAVTTLMIPMQNCVFLTLLSIKIFNLMSKTNEIGYIKWRETFRCKWRLDTTVCNNKQRWNGDKCICDRKELIDKGVCDKEFIWNPSNFEYQCDKSCDVGDKWRKKLVHKLVKNA